MLEASLERNGITHKVNVLPMDNAVLAFFFEDTLKIGTLAVSTPGLRDGAVGTSSVLLGGKYLITARALSERVAATYNKMSIVSVNTKLAEGEALRLFVELLNKAKPKGPATDAKD